VGFVVWGLVLGMVMGNALHLGQAGERAGWLGRGRSVIDGLVVVGIAVW
jgi:hypothetical protein